MTTSLVVLVIFVATYVFVVTERVHRTTVVLFSAAILIISNLLPLSEAWGRYIDFNTIGLLSGMMIIVAILKRTGVFQWVAIKAVKLARGNPWYIFVMFSLTTAVFSAFLDNVTTVLLVTPIILLITDTLGKSPLPYLVAGIIASNIGGSATLIGDPPNILIGSAAGLTFLDFIVNLTPIMVLLLALNIWLLRRIFRRGFRTDQERRLKVLSLDERKALKDPVLLKRSLLIFGATIAAFLVHHHINLSPAAVALGGAAVLLLLSRVHPEEVFRDIEWTTLLFFVGLFVIVGALERAGLISALASGISSFAQHPAFVAILVLWLSAFAAAFMSAVPMAAAVIPLVKHLGVQLNLQPIQLIPLWWALALGACLGGNGTLVGHLANMVVAGISEKHGGSLSRLTFKRYTKMGLPLMLLSLVIATAYLWLRYLR